MTSRLTRPNRKLWLLDPSGLLAGDVILEMGSRLQSKAIARIDAADYSHALMWVGGTDLIEAVGQGARVISFARVIIEDPHRWMVLRHLEDRAAAERAAFEARKVAHKGYDLKGALNTKLSIRATADHTKLFCSQLIAVSYLRAGVALLEGTASHMVTPGMLQHKSRLTKIETPLVEIPSAQLAGAEQFLDRDRAYLDSPMYKEMIASRDAFEAVVVRANALEVPKVDGVQFPPGNLNELLDVLRVATGADADSVSDALLTELKQKDYFKLIAEPFLNLMLVLETEISNAHKKSVAEKREFLDWLQVSSLKQTRERFRHNARISQDVYARTNQKLWQELAAMYFINKNANRYSDRSRSPNRHI